MKSLFTFGSLKSKSFDYFDVQNQICLLLSDIFFHTYCNLSWQWFFWCCPLSDILKWTNSSFKGGDGGYPTLLKVFICCLSATRVRVRARVRVVYNVDASAFPTVQHFNRKITIIWSNQVQKGNVTTSSNGAFHVAFKCLLLCFLLHFWHHKSDDV